MCSERWLAATTIQLRRLLLASTPHQSTAELAQFPVDNLVGIYHLVDRADAINLELRADHSFRWSLRGCDTWTNDTGRYKLKTPTQLVLLPEQGRSRLPWSGAILREVGEVQMELTSGKLVESIMFGGLREQIWEPDAPAPP